MNTYIFLTSEFSFLSSFAQESIQIPNSSFQPNDMIIFSISNCVAGLAKVSHILETDSGQKLHLHFQNVFLKENRYEIYHSIFENLFTSSFENSISKIRNENANIIIDIINNLEDDYGFFITNIESLWEEEKERDEILKRQQAKSQNPFVYKRFNYESLNPHQQSQFFLNEIASICNVHSWTATNDKNRIHNGVKLGQFDIDSFPLLKTDKDNLQIIELIDTIWIKENRPVCAFETETSTSIYSGLLRLSDISTIISTSNFSMYIVAPKERSKKFLKEINRPTFKHLNLDKHCRFIPLESLKSLYEKIIGLDGYVDYHIIDMISQTPNQLEQILH